MASPNLARSPRDDDGGMWNESDDEGLDARSMTVPHVVLDRKASFDQLRHLLTKEVHRLSGRPGVPPLLRAWVCASHIDVLLSVCLASRTSHSSRWFRPLRRSYRQLARFRRQLARSSRQLARSPRHLVGTSRQLARLCTHLVSYVLGLDLQRVVFARHPQCVRAKWLLDRVEGRRLIDCGC